MTTTNPAATYLTTAEVAEWLRMSRRTVQRLVAAGSIPHVYVGRRCLFPKAVVAEYLANNPIPVPTQAPPTVGYSGPDVARIIGITYRRLDRWDSEGVVSPSIRAAHGSGTRREYSRHDLEVAAVVATLARFVLWPEAVHAASALTAADTLDGMALLIVDGHPELVPADLDVRTQEGTVVVLVRIADITAELPPTTEGT